MCEHRAPFAAWQFDNMAVSKYGNMTGVVGTQNQILISSKKLSFFIVSHILKLNSLECKYDKDINTD